MKCWGYNSDGALGIGKNTGPESCMGDSTTYACSTHPITVQGITDVKSISVGSGSVCVILTDRRIECWGHNDDGELGNGSKTDSNTPVFVLGIEYDKNAERIETGYSHTCAILSNGELKCWGGQLGNLVETEPEESNELMNRDSSGDVTVPTTVNVNPLPILSVAEGTDLELVSHTCVVVADGSVKCWGRNNSGQLGNGKYIDSDVPVEAYTPSGVYSEAENQKKEQGKMLQDFKKLLAELKKLGQKIRPLQYSILQDINEIENNTAPTKINEKWTKLGLYLKNSYGPVLVDFLEKYCDAGMQEAEILKKDVEMEDIAKYPANMSVSEIVRKEVLVGAGIQDLSKVYLNQVTVRYSTMEGVKDIGVKQIDLMYDDSITQCGTIANQLGY